VSGHSIVCRGAEVAPDAFILDSVVLPGAAIGSRCVVARSVIGPLIRVPEGSVLVDAVMANPRLGDRPADFRVSSGIPTAETPKDALPSWSR
jgi:ADP-glucose pyrophosphorylase